MRWPLLDALQLILCTCRCAVVILIRLRINYRVLKIILPFIRWYLRCRKMLHMKVFWSQLLLCCVKCVVCLYGQLDFINSVKFMRSILLQSKCTFCNFVHVCLSKWRVINPSACGHLNPSSYCDVGRLFCGVFKLWSKLQRKKMNK